MADRSTRTPEEARAWLDRHGVTVSAWARAHGFEPAIVLALLKGRTTGRWGKAYQAAVALGLRSPPDADDPYPLDKAGALSGPAPASMTQREEPLP